MDKIEELAQLRENLVDDIELLHTQRLNIALEMISARTYSTISTA